MKNNENQFELSVIERILSLKNDRESDSSFASRCGIPQTTFSGYVSKGRAPNVVYLKRIADETGSSTSWLLTGEGPMRKDAERSRAIRAVQSKDFRNYNPGRYAPDYRMGNGAG